MSSSFWSSKRVTGEMESESQGCWMACDALNLWSGSRTRQHLIKSMKARSSVVRIYSSLLLSGILIIPYSSSSIRKGE